MVSLAHCILQYSLCMDFYITHLAIDVAPGAMYRWAAKNP